MKSDENVKEITVIIVEDHDKVRAAVRAILEAAGDIEVVGEAAEGTQAIALTEQVHPDVLVLDLDLVMITGEIALGPLLKKFPRTRVLILTSYDDVQVARGFLDKGAAGCLLKEDVPDSLVEGVHEVQEHMGWVSPHLHV